MDWSSISCLKRSNYAKKIKTKPMDKEARVTDHGGLEGKRRNSDFFSCCSIRTLKHFAMM